MGGAASDIWFRRPGLYRVFLLQTTMPAASLLVSTGLFDSKICFFSNFPPGFQVTRTHSFECLMWQRISPALQQRFCAFAFVFTLVRDRLVVGRLTSYSSFSGISSMPAAPLLPANLASMSPSSRRPLALRPLGTRRDFCWRCLTCAPGPPFRILQGQRL